MSYIEKTIVRIARPGIQRRSAAFECLLRILAAAILLSFTNAYSDDAQDELIVFGQLEETTPLQLAKYGNRVEIVTANDIETGGFDDVAQTLQMRVPGLYLAPKNGAFDYVGCSLQG